MTRNTTSSMDKRPSMDRHHIDLRVKARLMLEKAGHQPRPLATMKGLCYAIEVELGSDRDCSIDEWVGRYLRHAARSTGGTGEIVPPRTPYKFKPLTTSPQMLANLERARQAQPRLWTPDGVGNGNERQHGFGRGS